MNAATLRKVFVADPVGKARTTIRIDYGNRTGRTHGAGSETGSVSGAASIVNLSTIVAILDASASSAAFKVGLRFRIRFPYAGLTASVIAAAGVDVPMENVPGFSDEAFSTRPAP